MRKILLQKLPVPLPLLVAMAISTSSSDAALLVYEGFDGYTTGDLNGQAVSSSSSGLSGAWDGSAYTNYHQITTTGLTFQGLATSGGALSIGTSTRLSGVAMNHAGVAAGGTLYSSYLVNLTRTPTVGSGVLTRVNGSSPTLASGYYSSFADGRNGLEPSVSYDGAIYNPANQSENSSALLTNQTYIVISSFTNVANSSAGNANLYVLNQEQYTNLLTIGLANLGTLTVGTASDQIWASAAQLGSTLNGSFDSTDFLQILSLDTTSTIDEIRYGTTLADVLPIPEPTSAALVALVGLGGFLRRRR